MKRLFALCALMVGSLACAQMPVLNQKLDVELEKVQVLLLASPSQTYRYVERQISGIQFKLGVNEEKYSVIYRLKTPHLPHLKA